MWAKYNWNWKFIYNPPEKLRNTERLPIGLCFSQFMMQVDVTVFIFANSNMAESHVIHILKNEETRPE